MASPTLEDAVVWLAASCDGAKSSDGKGFNKFDAAFGTAMAEKVISGGQLSDQEYRDIYKMLGKYNKQLADGEMDIRLIPKKQPGNLPEEETSNKISDAVDAWIAQYHFVCRTDGNILYYYKNGVYVPKGELLLSEMAEQEFHGKCSNNMVKEIIGMTKRRTYVDPKNFDVNPDIINVKNGLLDIWTGELKPHTHELYYTVQLPVTFDPDASCPKIKNFFEEIVILDDVPLLEEIAGWILWRPYDIHKAIMLWGGGRNGKSAFLRLLEALHGIENISHVSLSKLVSERFAGIDLVGKAGNFFGDLPAKDLSETDIFKAVTGQDTIRVEDKFMKAFDILNTAKMVFSANKLPKSSDDSNGFYSRWIIIKFPFQFGTPERPFNKNLDNELSTPEELSGLLNLSLVALKRMKQNNWNFSYRLTLEDIKDMYKRLSDPVYAYLQDCCESSKPSANSYVIKSDLYNDFKIYAAENNLAPMSMTKFVTSVEDQSYITVDVYRPSISGVNGVHQIKAWLGIKMKN
jgi:putative DNA primase/helicase